MKLEPGGRYEVFPDPPGLIEFINHVRDNERTLTTTHLILWIKANQREWLNNYLATKQQSTSYNSLLRLLHASAIVTAYPVSVPPRTRSSKTILRSSTASTLPALHLGGARRKLQNLERGDHSLRMMAVLQVRANGTKLPILFIMKRVPGGRIDSGELSTFPPGHHYAVQERAWMDKRVWATYLRNVLGEAIDEPSVVLLDNFESHVSGESYNIMYEELVPCVRCHRTRRPCVNPLTLG
ncbi:hypothetical protein DYB37_012604 [Aphanomyces astaci]|uniref:DDE-1 domain-containing protein n=1 Tax=Aphanomyces astaci TaxID=112090 RepID=A0A3R7BR50_APHAT|nr:hypothetical protein DYB35_003111 [Aphanomyces astaci]RHZ20927.1 hypothetical protein DYB37_012604 [Aphanomyces astaci]